MFNTLLSSLADTLDGEVNVAMLVYQSGEAAIQLFSGDSPQARKILGAALPALATQGDYKVLLVQPEDQDFDVSLVPGQPNGDRDGQGEGGAGGKVHPAEEQIQGESQE